LRFAALGADHQDGHRVERRDAAQLDDQFVTVHHRHIPVDHGEIQRSGTPKKLHGGPSVRGLDDLETALLQPTARIARMDRESSMTMAFRVITPG